MAIRSHKAGESPTEHTDSHFSLCTSLVLLLHFHRSKQPLDSRSTGPQKKLGDAGGGGADTVTVSRDYLQQLLHSSLMREHVEDFNSLPVSLAPLSYRPPPPPPPPQHKEYSTVPTSRSTHEYDREREKKHVITDYSHVPGLGGEHWDRGGEYDGYESRGQWNRERDGYDMSPHPAAKGTLRKWSEGKRKRARKGWMRDRERSIVLVARKSGGRREGGNG